MARPSWERGYFDWVGEAFEWIALALFVLLFLTAVVAPWLAVWWAFSTFGTNTWQPWVALCLACVFCGGGIRIRLGRAR